MSAAALKLIAFLLGVPRFKPRHLFLQFVHPLGQGKLLFLRQQDFALEVYDRAVTSRSILDVLKSLGHIEGGLGRVQASKRFGASGERDLNRLKSSAFEKLNVAA